MNLGPEKFSMHCNLPRREEAIEALFSLAWKKEKKERPKWLIKELRKYC